MKKINYEINEKSRIINYFYTQYSNSIDIIITLYNSIQRYNDNAGQQQT